MTGDVVVRERDGAEHRITLKAGRIVAARVAGWFDPLLDAMRRDGALSPSEWQRALEALGRSERPAGQLAVEVGASHAAVRAALDRQTRRAVRAALERAAEHGRDGWLEPREIGPTEPVTSLSVDEVLGDPPARERPPRASGARPRRTPPSRPAPLDRKALRRLAFALHPDRHGHLDPEARAALGARLGALTAEYHRSSRGV